MNVKEGEDGLCLLSVGKTNLCHDNLEELTGKSVEQFNQAAISLQSKTLEELKNELNLAVALAGK